MQLKITNNLTKNSVILEDIIDKGTSTMFYAVDIGLNGDFEDGEYTYELIDEGKTVSKGLMQIGDYEKDPQQYKEYKDNNDNGYIVYGG
jgi:hypothetical protein